MATPKSITVVVTVDNEDVRDLIRAQHIASQLATKHPQMIELVELNKHLTDTLVNAYSKRKVYR